MFAEIWVRRFHSQYADGVQVWVSLSHANMSASPAWLPGRMPFFIDAASS